MSGTRPPYPVTPDGRYMVVRGRLWRVSNPNLAPEQRQGHVQALMAARREVRTAKQAGDPARLAAARARVDAAKIALGERGPAWWADGEEDFNRHLVRNTPYRGWFEQLADAGPGAGAPREGAARADRAGPLDPAGDGRIRRPARTVRDRPLR